MGEHYPCIKVRVGDQTYTSSCASILVGSRSMPRPGNVGSANSPRCGVTGLARKCWLIAFHFTKYSWIGVNSGDCASEKCNPAGVEWPCGITTRSCTDA